MSKHNEIRIDDGLLESALRELQPVPVEVDRDALMYRAGFQTARGSSGAVSSLPFWKATTGLMTAATIALGVLLAQQSSQPETFTVAEPSTTETLDPTTPSTAGRLSPPANESVAEATQVEEPIPPRTINPLLFADPANNFLALRAAVLEHGVETWPTDYRQPRQFTEPEEPAQPRTPPSTIMSLMKELLPASPTSAQSEPEHEPDESEPNQTSATLPEPIV